MPNKSIQRLSTKHCIKIAISKFISNVETFEINLKFDTIVNLKKHYLGEHRFIGISTNRKQLMVKQTIF